MSVKRDNEISNQSLEIKQDAAFYLPKNKIPMHDRSAINENSLNGGMEG